MVYSAASMLTFPKGSLKIGHTLWKLRMGNTSRRPNMYALRMAKRRETGLSSLVPILHLQRFVFWSFANGFKILIVYRLSGIDTRTHV